MEYTSSVGTLLKEARIQQGRSVEQVTKETYISTRFIQALEDEQYEEFTSDVYLVGFLKSYADYLGLDSRKIVQRFRNVRMQEQPTPIAELLKKRAWHRTPLFIVLAIIFGIGLLCVTAYALFVEDPSRASSIFRSVTSRNDTEVSGTSRDDTEVSVTYTLDDNYLEREFRAGDMIDLSTEQQSYTLLLRRISRVVVIDSPDGRLRVGENERTVFAISQSQGVWVELLVQRIIRDQGSPIAIMRLRMNEEDVTPTDSVIAESTETPPVDIVYGNTTVASRKRASIELGQYDAAPTFVTQMTFASPVFLRHQIDGNAPVSQLYNAGDVLTLEPEQRLSVWTTNSGAVIFQVADRIIPIGADGRVTSFTVEKVSARVSDEAILRVVPLY